MQRLTDATFELLKQQLINRHNEKVDTYYKSGRRNYYNQQKPPHEYNTILKRTLEQRIENLYGDACQSDIFILRKMLNMMRMRMLKARHEKKFITPSVSNIEWNRSRHITMFDAISDTIQILKEREEERKESYINA